MPGRLQIDGEMQLVPGDFYEDRFCIAESLCSQAGSPAELLTVWVRCVDFTPDNPLPLSVLSCSSSQIRFIGSVEQSARS